MRSSFRRSLPPSLPFPCRVGYLFMRISPKHERQAEGDTEEAAVREKKGGKEESVSRLLFPLDRIGGTWRARMRPFTPRTHAMKHRFQREFFFSPHDPAPRISRVWGQGGGERLPSNSFRDSCNGSPQLFCVGGTHGPEAVRISSFLWQLCLSPLP